MAKFQQHDLVRVNRDIYGKKINVEATVVAITNQYLVLELPDGQSFHCYKADADLIWSATQR
jgi:hypothetical protein